MRWLEVANSAEIGAEAMIAGKAGTGALGVFLRLPTPTEARAQVGIRLGRESGG